MGKRTGGAARGKGTLSGKHGSATPFFTTFLISIFQPVKVYNATPNHAKIRRGMVSLWIDGRLMFSIWRQNQDV